MENPNSLIFIEEAQIKGYDVDLHQRATIPAMIHLMHGAALQQILKLKISAKELATQNLGWVLVQQDLEFFRQPLLGEVVTIKTHPAGKVRVFTYRDFQIKDEQGNTCTQGSSSWLLMNIEKRKMVAQYPPHIDEMLEASAAFDHLPRPESLRIRIKNAEWKKSFQVGYHDLDFNGHLSNFYFFKWMLDTLPSDFLKTNTLQKLQIKFKEECYLDDVVEVEVAKLEEGGFVHVLLKNGKVLAESKTIWK